ncbi:MAG: sulfurtransferase [Fusobacteriaceae bacterium]
MKKIIAMILLVLFGITIFAKDYKEYRSEKLISVTQASELIKKGGDIAIIDMRSSTKYMIGHLPNSFNVWRPDVEPKDKRYGEIGGMRSSREEMAKLLGSFGITNKTTIIVYGENLDEYRLWWILDLYGHENVKIIDGGYKAWTNAKLPTKMGGAPKVATKKYEFLTATDKPTLAMKEEVKTALGNDKIIILDTRSVAEHDGTDLKSGAFAKGRIPSKYFVEYQLVFGNDGTMKSYAELKDFYAKSGIDGTKLVIPYCQSAVRSAVTTFVLKELLGYKNVKNYDGSWIEWSYEVKNNKYPVEIGK